MTDLEKLKDQLERKNAKVQKITALLETLSLEEAALAAKVTEAELVRDQAKMKVNGSERDESSYRSSIYSKMINRPSSAHPYVKALMAIRQTTASMTPAIRKLNKRYQRRTRIYKDMNKKTSDLRHMITVYTKQIKQLQGTIETAERNGGVVTHATRPTQY